MKKALVFTVGFAFAAGALSAHAGDDKELYKKKNMEGACVCPSSTAMTVAWCDHCDVGMVFGHKIKSKEMVTAMLPKKVDATAMKCNGCKTAMASNTKCDHCNVAFNSGMAYKSPVAVVMSKGTIVLIDEVNCPTCRTAIEKGKGNCTGCNVGVVSGLVFKSDDDYKAAKRANTILAKATNKSKTCTGCAVAMVTDGECKGCKAGFKEGRMIKTKGD